MREPRPQRRRGGVVAGRKRRPIAGRRSLRAVQCDGYFRKLQGPGRIKVRFARADGMEAIAEVTFLNDVTMRLDRHFVIPFTADQSDHLVIRKGSVLWLSE